MSHYFYIAMWPRKPTLNNERQFLKYFSTAASTINRNIYHELYILFCYYFWYTNKMLNKMLRCALHVYILNETGLMWLTNIILLFSSKLKFLCHVLTLSQLLLFLSSAKIVLHFLFTFCPLWFPAFHVWCVKASYKHCLFSVFIFCRLPSISRKSKPQKPCRNGKNHCL